MVGLAPALGGGNRTGRVFTGDLPGGSGNWLFRALYEIGMANQPTSAHRDDGLKLTKVYVTAALRCAPPKNRPTAGELDNCRPYLGEEFKILNQVKVVVALGRIAHDAILKVLGVRLALYPFAHGAEHRVKAKEGMSLLLDTYHPSRQNTLTGKLTWLMWIAIWRRVKQLAL